MIVATILATAPAVGLAQDFLERPLDEDFILGQAIVKLRTTSGDSLNLQTIESYGLELGLGVDFIGVTSGGEMILSIGGSSLASTFSQESLRSETLAAIEMLRSHPDVEYAEPNYLMHILTEPNDPDYRIQWHYFEYGSRSNQSLGGISLPTVWDENRGSQNIVVAVIDTGILPDHPDIAGSPNLLPGFDMISNFGNGYPDFANDGDGRDDDPTDPGDAVDAGECGRSSSAQPNSWHGTHVAGTVGVGNTNNRLGVAGVAWEIGVLPVRVLGKCGGATSDVTDGIRWAAGLPVPGINENPTPARVINLSLGGFGKCAQSRAYQNAINDAVAAGATIVVAAGNSSTNAANFRPASCNNVITVAANDLRGHLARYSNFGQTIEILAPGGDNYRDDNKDGIVDGVYSMVNPSAGTYAHYNGTSMAAPHVSGVVALMLSVTPSLTPASVLDVLQTTARRRSNQQCPNYCGAGLIDAQAAVSALR